MQSDERQPSSGVSSVKERSAFYSVDALAGKPWKSDPFGISRDRQDHFRPAISAKSPRVAHPRPLLEVTGNCGRFAIVGQPRVAAPAFLEDPNAFQNFVRVVREASGRIDFLA